MFDEDKAIEYINDRLNDRYGITYHEDEILNVIDIIWDYYEDHGMLSINASSDDDDLDVADLKVRVAKMLAKDKQSEINPEHIDSIVDAELGYETIAEDEDDI